MSQSPTPAIGSYAREDESEYVVPENDVQDVLQAFDDADCRAILETITDSEEGLTANELSETCGVPLSTMYRKLERLTDAGLVEERLRIRRSGKHVSEYVRRIEDVRIAVDTDDGIEVRVSRCEADASFGSPVFGD